jgi:hypothetical protein
MPPIEEAPIRRYRQAVALDDIEVGTEIMKPALQFPSGRPLAELVFSKSRQKTRPSPSRDGTGSSRYGAGIEVLSLNPESLSGSLGAAAAGRPTGAYLYPVF